FPPHSRLDEFPEAHETVFLREHFAHLYGPVAMVEDKSAPLLHVEMRAPPSALPSASNRSTMRMSVMYPGVEFRPSSMAKNPDGPPPLDRSKRDSDLLKKAILTNPFIKTLDDQLHERHLRTLMITSSLAAEANNKSSFDMQDAPEFAGEFDTPKKLVHV
ncbi:unnamed protein product, partial [Timema podura]|nr:unnamed protein product [Timema podura]